MRGEKTLDTEGQRAPKRVFAQGKVRDAKLDRFELREELACVASAVGISVGTCGACRGVGREVASAKRGPPYAKKFFIVQSPNFGALVPAKACECPRLRC